MPTLDLNVAHHPAVVEQFEKRTSDVQLRIADKITEFAGSMNFVYLHVALFALWMLVLERSPWPTLTLAVSDTAQQDRGPELARKTASI